MYYFFIYNKTAEKLIEKTRGIKIAFDDIFVLPY